MPTMPNKLTIRDIARLAGVSTATVSRVLNNKPDVDPVTRERIMGIVNEHRYVPSATASSLAGGRSSLLGVLVPSLTWPLMPNILQGIAEVVEQTNYELVLYSISHRTDRSSLIDHILSTRLIDGLIAVYPDGIARSEMVSDVNREASTHLVELYQRGLPLVILDDQRLPSATPWVGPDNLIGAYAAVHHLIRLGHRRIAYVQGPQQYQCSHDRYAGYQQALQEAGIANDPILFFQGDFTTPGGYNAGLQLLELAERPTAVFAANDQMAWGILAAGKARDIAMPDELAVIGFDDTALSAHTRPALTTVRQPFQEMGKSAAELLLTLVSMPKNLSNGWYDPVSHLLRAHVGMDTQNPIHVQLPTELVIRESCGADQADQEQTAPAFRIPVK